MAENVDNLVLEQLRLIRETLGKVQSDIKDIREDISDVKSEQINQTGVLMALGGYMRTIDMRVEHLEKMMGVDA